MSEADMLVADAPETLSRRELALIAAFWALYGALSISNRLLDGRGPNAGGLTSGAIIVAFSDSLCWAVLTAMIFWLVSRYSSERLSRSGQYLLLGALGIVVVVSVGAVGTEMRALFDSPPVQTRGHRQGRQPVWFSMLYALVTYMGVVSAAFARSFSQRYHVRREQAGLLQRQLAEARLDALRRQLDPHFLFNTLNAVSSLVERDPRGVRRMISRLGDLLRFSLEGASEPEITLRRELALLGQYLDIMQVRFHERLTVETHAAEATMELLVPTLILQPLVENAIKHGVDELPEGGRVTIDASLEGGTLVLRVGDNGPRGMHLEQVLGHPATTGSGVGVHNTIARLKELYGARQSFCMWPGPDTGTVVEIRLPAHDHHGLREDARNA